MSLEKVIFGPAHLIFMEEKPQANIIHTSQTTEF